MWNECTWTDEEGSESDEEEHTDQTKGGFVSTKRPKDEDPEAKKERKQAVKDAQAEKRKVKVKKHIKKRKTQTGKNATKKWYF